MRNEDFNAFIRTVDFNQDVDGFFVGFGQNNRNGSLFKLAIFEGKIACFKENGLLFQVPFGIDLGTFLVLTQEFGIIHERFIYERVEVIEDEFLEHTEDWEESLPEKDKQLMQVKNSKFMELLNKGKKKQN